MLVSTLYSVHFVAYQDGMFHRYLLRDVYLHTA